MGGPLLRPMSASLGEANRGASRPPAGGLLLPGSDPLPRRAGSVAGNDPGTECLPQDSNLPPTD